MGQPVGVLVDDVLLGHHRFAVDHQPEVEPRAAHVGADNVVVAVGAGEGGDADQPAGRAGVDRPQRGRAGRGQHPPVGLHDQQRGREPALQLTQVPRGGRTDVTVQHRGDRALVLAQPGRHLRRAGHEHIRDRLCQGRCQGLLVRRVREGPQQRDGDGVELVLRDHPGDPLDGRVGVQVDHHLAARVDPLLHLDHSTRHDQRRRQPAAVHREHTFDRPAGDPSGTAHHRECVTVPGGGDQPDPRTPPFEDRVRADGGSVPETLGPLEQGGQVDAGGFRPADSARRARRPPGRPLWTRPSRSDGLPAGPAERSR